MTTTKLYPHVTGIRGNAGEDPTVLAVTAVLDPSENYPESGRIIIGSPKKSDKLEGYIPRTGGFCCGVEGALRLIATLQCAVAEVLSATGRGVGHIGVNMREAARSVLEKYEATEDRALLTEIPEYLLARAVTMDIATELVKVASSPEASAVGAGISAGQVIELRGYAGALRGYVEDPSADPVRATEYGRVAEAIERGLVALDSWSPLDPVSRQTIEAWVARLPKIVVKITLVSTSQIVGVATDIELALRALLGPSPLMSVSRAGGRAADGGSTP
jgi:hypothetical protein